MSIAGGQAEFSEVVHDTPFVNPVSDESGGTREIGRGGKSKASPERMRQSMDILLDA